MIPVTKIQLLEDLRDRGTRGLSRREARARYGAAFVLLLRSLEHDGHVLRWHESRYGDHGWWRVELLAEAVAPPAAAADPQIAFDVNGNAPPRSALFGDLEAA